MPKKKPLLPEWCEALVAARRASGHTQAEVARHANAARRSVVRWEHNWAYPTPLYRSDLIRWASRFVPSPQRERMFEAFFVTSEEIATIPPNERTWMDDAKERSQGTERAIHEAAERLDVRTRAFREALVSVLDAIAESGHSLNHARALIRGAPRD